MTFFLAWYVRLLSSLSAASETYHPGLGPHFLMMFAVVCAPSLKCFTAKAHAVSPELSPTNESFGHKSSGTHFGFDWPLQGSDPASHLQIRLQKLA